MSVRRPTQARSGAAFTLLETLVVIAIIGILLALLFPVFERGRARSKRAACISNLRQIGIALQSFRHEHESIYPTGVPVVSGGVREFYFNAFNGFKDGWWDHAHRVFQCISNDLDVPKLLICPADRYRLPSDTFEDLKLENVSYFSVISGQGKLEGPDAIWAGDAAYEFTMAEVRRMYSDETPIAIRPWPLHRGGRGNLLYSDGRVEGYGKEGALSMRGLFIEQNPSLGAPPTPPGPNDSEGQTTSNSRGDSSGGGSGKGSAGSGGGAYSVLDQALGGKGPQSGSRSSGGAPSGSSTTATRPASGPPRDSETAESPVPIQTNTNRARTFAELTAEFTNRPQPVVEARTNDIAVVAQAELPPPLAEERSWAWLFWVILATAAIAAAEWYRRKAKRSRRPAAAAS